jgi:hypothetical protein
MSESHELCLKKIFGNYLCRIYFNPSNRLECENDLEIRKALPWDKHNSSVPGVLRVKSFSYEPTSRIELSGGFLFRFVNNDLERESAKRKSASFMLGIFWDSVEITVF